MRLRIPGSGDFIVTFPSLCGHINAESSFKLDLRGKTECIVNLKVTSIEIVEGRTKSFQRHRKLRYVHNGKKSQTDINLDPRIWTRELACVTQSLSEVHLHNKS
jgi:hypothetical protein